MKSKEEILLSDPEQMELTLRSVPDPLLAWYYSHARKLPWRSEPTPYHVWLSEIMLQQTRVEAVIPYYLRFLEALPDIPSLANAEEEQLHKLWEGLGYYSRVRNLQKAARQVMERYDGILPPSYELLLDLSGIGEYTAGAISSIAFGIPEPAVDGNVLRVVSRLIASEADVTKPQVKAAYRTALKDILPQTAPGDFNQAFMELGATICLPNGAPRCEACPLRSSCIGYQQGNPTLYPLKSEKKPRRTEEKTVFLIGVSDRVLIRKREEKGLLAGLWEFPNVDRSLDEQEAIAWLEQAGLRVLRLTPLPDGKHIFTHIEWKLKGFFAECEPFTPIEGERLVNREELAREYSVPNAFAAYKKAWLFQK